MNFEKIKLELEDYFRETLDQEFEFKIDSGIMSVSGDFYCEELDSFVGINFIISDCEFATFNFFLKMIDGDEYDALVKINQFNIDNDMFYASVDSIVQLKNHIDLLHDYDVLDYTKLIIEEFFDEDFMYSLKTLYE